jgi:hypothetical protein
VPSRARLPLLGLALLLPLAFFAATRCTSEMDPTPDGPVGYGVLEFDSRGDGVLDDPNALGTNVLLDWADLEPDEGVYDWEELDAALAVAEVHGKRVAPRVYTNVGVFDQATPDWVFDAGAEAYYPEGDVRQPVPTDDVFTAKFGAFLRAFGDRYDGDRAIEFIQTNAGMGTYGEMVWGVGDGDRPDGWSSDEQIETSKYWIDRWREAFPTTPLVLMQNYIGFDVLDEVAEYAVDRNFYLQANDPYHQDDSQEIMAKYDGDTKIVMEIENRGCESAVGESFGDLLDVTFEGGFAIDYLVICGESFELEPGRVAQALGRLRRTDE